MSGESVGQAKESSQAKEAQIFVENPQEILSIARSLREKGYDHVISLSAVDYPKTNEIHVIIHVSSYSVKDLQPKVLEIRVRLDRKEPRMPSLIKIWPSVEFQEREAFEMFGINFEGHPDLRNILLDPEDFAGVHPLLKDFKVPEEDIMLRRREEVKSGPSK
ncbi:MAG: NADH-quinone oxidoreductase subunit C [Fervidicoccaceae archaeon]